MVNFHSALDKRGFYGAFLIRHGSMRGRHAAITRADAAQNVGKVRGWRATNEKKRLSVRGLNLTGISVPPVGHPGLPPNSDGLPFIYQTKKAPADEAGVWKLTVFTAGLPGKGSIERDGSVRQ